MAQLHSIAEFTEMFDTLFAEHDKNHNGALEKDEARVFMQAVNAARPDGHEFDEVKFEELFAARSVDGAIPKAICHGALLKRGQALGFIASE